MYHHILAFVIGYILDILIGDPHSMPHPIRQIGRLIGSLEGVLYKADYPPEKKKRNGRILVISVITITATVITGTLLFAYIVNDIAGIVVEAVCTYYILATKSLKDESMKVYDELKKGDIVSARYMLSMIVGRDTEKLNEDEVSKAAIETVAENASDGVIAPMIYTAVGGPILGFIYKAINTMDSMIGYKNDKYLDFGSCAARLDDVVNYIPARISAVYMIFATYILQLFSGKKENEAIGRAILSYSGKRALYIFRRDRRKHHSPNSAHTESVCAGALGIRLAGPSYYFGQRVDKPYIGDFDRVIETEDIKRANILMYMTSVTSFLSLLLILCIIAVII